MKECLSCTNNTFKNLPTFSEAKRAEGRIQTSQALGILTFAFIYSYQFHNSMDLGVKRVKILNPLKWSSLSCKSHSFDIHFKLHIFKEGPMVLPLLWSKGTSKSSSAGFHLQKRKTAWKGSVTSLRAYCY